MAQLLEAPVLGPLEEELGVVVEPDDVLVDVEDVDVLVELSLELAEVVELLAGSLFLAPPELLYRSAYQPPPLRMKPAPPETWRLALASWHFGHSVSGAALMDCSASQAWPQAVQAYS
jgi:hypothetical protein